MTQFIGTDDVAKRLGIKPRHVHILAEAGIIPRQEVDSTFIYKWDDVHTAMMQKSDKQIPKINVNVNEYLQIVESIEFKKSVIVRIIRELYLIFKFI